MKPISEELVEKISKKISSIKPLEVNEEIQKVGQLQPDLVAFVMDSTEGLNPEAQELAIYLFFVVYRIFQASGAKIRKVSYAEIDTIFEKNETLFENEESPDPLSDPLKIFPVLIQPYLIRYLSEALPEEEGPTTAVNEEEKGAIFLILKTVIEVLDKAASSHCQAPK
jgi:hypothetical protein